MISTSNELLRNIAALCRVCSAPGSHSLFAKIPPYLHEHPRECPRWTLPICKLLAEVTGIEISEDDGLPQRICVLCISYLKHAYIFRRQTIDNVAAVLAARYLIGIEMRQGKDGSLKTKDTELVPTAVFVPAVIARTEVADVANRMMNVATNGSISFRKNLDKEVIRHIMGGSVKSKKKNNAEEEQRYIQDFETSRLQASPVGTGGYFTYTEKEFEEDDVMELDVLKEHNISFNLPVDYKEKKCPSCKKRFMFDDSLSEHLEKCLQFTLIKFIREVYHLLCLKENRAISSFEFIRRVVFAIRRSVQQIAPLNDAIADKEEEEENEMPTAEQTVEEPTEIKRSYLKNLEKLRMNYNQEGNKIPSPALPQPIEDGRSSITTGSTSISPIVTVTRCEECQVQFETVTELEAHNLNYHRGLPAASVALNNQQPVSPFPKHILLLAAKDVPLIKNRLLSDTPEPIAGGDSPGEDTFKTVQCSTCKKRFHMISQLDEHRIRCHSRKSPRQHSGQGSPVDRNRKNLNASYFHTMEQLKNVK
ncbi:uncharacterized protein LOC129724878 [Wyeomyia smithii]|uniref:uncharacterized protein LOC129724878 n=1 Tax=Wyeomyia smithii TaxID=174621 RepID=UPI0024681714|nr:uncharacterized protein LOC129724878 [Wyeomyia smithii]XP_055536128.1 uncharacterized protein LOC129724878 [Wyeomyia smithii]